MRRPRIAVRTEMLVVGLLVLAVGCVYHFKPWLTDQRGVVAATPVGFPLTGAEVPLQEGEQACLAPVGMTPRDSVAVFAAESAGGAPAPIRVTLTGPGYSASAVARDYADGKPIALPIRPPGRDLLARVCFAADGGDVTLVAATDARAASLLTRTEVDGRPVEEDVTLRFDEAGTQSMLDQASDGFEWLSVWKPGIVGPALLWLLAALVVVAVPLLVLLAFAGSFSRRDD